MSPRSSLVYSLGWAALALPSLPGAQNYHGAASQSPWHPSLTGTFAGISAGHYGPGVKLDAVVQAGSRLVLLSDPAKETFFSLFANDVSSFAHLPASTAGGLDRILAVESARVAVYEWSDSAASFDGGTPLDDLSSQPESVAIVVDPVDGASILAGLETDGRTLFVGTLQGTPLTYVEQGRFTMVEDVRSWQLMQWDGAAGLELLVHSLSEVHLLRASGTPLIPSIAASGTTSILQRFHDPVLMADRGFWFTELSGPGDYVGVLFDQRFPPDLEPALLFGPVALAQVGFLDYDGDRRLDMWFSNASAAEAYVLYGHEAPVFPFDSTFGVNLDLTTIIPLDGDPKSGIDSVLPSLGATGDFDLDGDVDFLFVSDEYQHVNFVRGDTIDESFLLPDIHEYVLTKDTSTDQETWTFDLNVSIPWPTYPRESGVSVIEKLCIEVFFQPEVGASIDPVPRAVVEYPLSEALPPSPRARLGRAPGAPSSAGTAGIPDPTDPVGDSGIGEVLGFPVSFGVNEDAPEAIYQFRLSLLGAGDVELGPARIEYYADDEGTSNQLAGQYSPWSSTEPDNGFGFHRRGGIGGFCALCP